MAAQAFDLAEQLHTPVILMSDPNPGMNDQLSEALIWDDKHAYDRGEVLNAKQLDEVEQFDRNLDVDGDGICYRTYLGTHPDKGIFSPAAHPEMSSQFTPKRAKKTLRICYGWNENLKLRPRFYPNPSCMPTIQAQTPV